MVAAVSRRQDESSTSRAFSGLLATACVDALNAPPLLGSNLTPASSKSFAGAAHVHTMCVSLMGKIRPSLHTAIYFEHNCAASGPESMSPPHTHGARLHGGAICVIKASCEQGAETREASLFTSEEPLGLLMHLVHLQPRSPEDGPLHSAPVLCSLCMSPHYAQCSASLQPVTIMPKAAMHILQRTACKDASYRHNCCPGLTAKSGGPSPKHCCLTAEK